MIIEQYSGRKCLLIHGIEDKDEVTDDVVVKMLHDKVELEILKKRHWSKSSPRNKRPIIVKFVGYNDCIKLTWTKKD